MTANLIERPAFGSVSVFGAMPPASTASTRAGAVAAVVWSIRAVATSAGEHREEKEGREHASQDGRMHDPNQTPV